LLSAKHIGRERSRRARGKPRHTPDGATLHYGDAQVDGGARRAERHAGDDDDALARPGEAFDVGVAAGAFGHVALIAGVVGDDRVGIVTSAFFTCQPRQASVGPHEQNQ